MTSVLNRPQLLSGNKYFYIALVFLVLGACSPKTNPTIQKPAPTTTPEVVAKPKVEDPKKVIPAKPIANPEMVISLILPFELNTINYKTATLKDIKKAEIAIDFYQGFKMGLDSVASSGNTKFKLQVFDSKDDPAQLVNLAAKAEIKNSDLIVGPVFPNGIKFFATYSKAMRKPMVSPLAASDQDLFNNPYLISVNNSVDQHAYKAVSFLKSQLKPKKVILIRSGQADEYKYAVPIKKGIDSLAKGLPFSEIGIKAVGYENVYKSLTPTGLNVIIVAGTERIFLLTL